MDIRLLANMGEFIRLAFPDEGGGKGIRELLDAIPDHLAPGSGRQLGEFVERIPQFPTVA